MNYLLLLHLTMLILNQQELLISQHFHYLKLTNQLLKQNQLRQLINLLLNLHNLLQLSSKVHRQLLVVLDFNLGFCMVFHEVILQHQQDQSNLLTKHTRHHDHQRHLLMYIW